MRSPRFIRTIAVVGLSALVLGAFVAAPAGAAKKKALKCSAFTPGIEGAAEAEVVKVTPKATEEKPVVIELEHGMAGPSEASLNEEQFFNIQIYGPSSGLYILEEFSDRHDVDLYLYDAAGEEVASSGAFNMAPVGPFSAGGNGGSNYESIPGFPVSTCEGYTIRSNAYLTSGTAATIKLWFGEEVAPE